MNKGSLIDEIVSLERGKGFVFQSSEIYGGLNGFFDYGPLGVELEENIKDAWWEDMVRRRDDIHGLDSSIIMNPKIWEASGHVDGFTDPMVDCKESKNAIPSRSVICCGDYCRWCKSWLSLSYRVRKHGGRGFRTCNEKKREKSL